MRKDVYHTSWTGENFERLYDFFKNGVNTKRASGFGQGHGFYVWCSLKKAFKHFIWHKKYFDIKGFPMILKFGVDINSSDWDLDYEVSSKMLVTYFMKHWDKISRIPNNVVKDGNGEYVVFSESESNHNLWGRDFIRFKTTKGKVDLMADEQPSTHEAVLTANLFKYLMTHDVLGLNMEREEIRLFEKGEALKYMGRRRLAPDKIFFRVKHRWFTNNNIERAKLFPPDVVALLKRL
ncbi:hypothetical protein CMO92_01560 [Candidatus Woesearchaeota archaeon]|nr:hypothetical protein [Candidatus Woesearchaeota archaeon]|tara:strand:- start:1211 stop:1918 length:708 start_codon:yes stop_codon:yes gene_type:complete